MSTTETTVPTTTWTVDPVHSGARFSVRHIVGRFRGEFPGLTATADTTGAPTLAGTVDVSSIQVKDENLKGHLLSPDFFDAESYPSITFTSSSLTFGADGTAQLEGELTLHGVTQPLSVSGPYSVVGADFAGKPRLGLSFETVVDRTAFGLVWNAPLAGGQLVLGDDVTLNVDLELVGS